MPSPVGYPDSKDHGANMGPIWGRQDPGGPHVSPMNFVIWVASSNNLGSYLEAHPDNIRMLKTRHLLFENFHL